MDNNLIDINGTCRGARCGVRGTDERQPDQQEGAFYITSSISRKYNTVQACIIQPGFGDVIKKLRLSNDTKQKISS